LTDITIVEAWDYQQCAIALLGPGRLASASTQLQNGTLVRTIKHGYGDLVVETLRSPYFHARGLTTSSRGIRCVGSTSTATPRRLTLSLARWSFPLDSKTNRRGPKPPENRTALRCHDSNQLMAVWRLAHRQLPDHR
jgi:hypothetical protein